MIVPFQQIIPSELAREIVQATELEHFADGSATAGNNAQIKNNRELLDQTEANLKYRAQIKDILWRHPIFLTLAMPNRIMDCLFSRYEVGMHYGDHVDNTIMDIQSGDPTRADLSMTIFLEDPSSYDGGELVINTDTAPQSFKLNPGDAILYPTANYHRVEPVTRGVRRVAIMWIQSIVPDPDKRQILTDMWMALDWLHRQIPPGTANENKTFMTLDKARSNLYRLWAEV
ncbi:MAG: Fe2+-dependent dioxygenase [Rhodospirillales bacterium]|nr:Fe2+-dependent dioxygenase [Rhodospirillales bacterium]